MTKRQSVYYKAAQMIARGDERYSCVAIAHSLFPINHFSSWGYAYIDLMSPTERTVGKYHIDRMDDLQAGIEGRLNVPPESRVYSKVNTETQQHLRVMLLLMMDQASS